MYIIKTQIGDELYQKLIQKKQAIGFSISAIIKIALLEYLKESKPIGRPLKIAEIQQEVIDRTIKEWLQADSDRTITYNEAERTVIIVKGGMSQTLALETFLSTQ